MVCVLMLSTLSVCAFASSSMTGKITIVGDKTTDITLSDSDKSVANPKTAIKVTPYDTNAAVIGAGSANGKIKDLKSALDKAGIGNVAKNTPNAKLYGFFTVELSSDAEVLKASVNAFGVSAQFLSDSAATGDVTLKSAKITIDVPGVTKDNSPSIVRYDADNGTFTTVDSTVSGSTLTFNAETNSDGIGYYALAYTATTASPKTNVSTYAFAIIFVIALAGATFAGKKAFAKR